MPLQHAEEKRVGVAEAAELSQLSPATIRRAADAGKLPHVRTPGGQRRFRVADVLALTAPQELAPAFPSAAGDAGGEAIPQPPHPHTLGGTS